MALTGIPLIASVILGTAGVIIMTVVLWTRFGRWRLLSRAAGVVLSEVLLVLTAGLIANRHEQFYPSWQALIGDTGTVTATVRPRAGRLDAQLARTPATHNASLVTWQPAASTGWQLAAPAGLVVPAGYTRRTSTVYPVLVELGSAVTVERAVEENTGIVVVTAVPSPRTAGAAMTDLPAALAQDLRVTGHGWALLADAAQAPLAARLAQANPGRFAALGILGGCPLPPGIRPGPAIAVAVSCPADSRPPAGVTALTAPPPLAWSSATDWAIQQTVPALTAPLALPKATR